MEFEWCEHSNFLSMGQMGRERLEPASSTMQCITNNRGWLLSSIQHERRDELAVERERHQTESQKGLCDAFTTRSRHVQLRGVSFEH